jgi:acylphosphatase
VLVKIAGRVQGVGFRYATAARARSLGVAGWVANRADGTVEAVFEGDEAVVASMVDWCRRGPRGAVVEDVQVTRREAAGREQEFVVR